MAATILSKMFIPAAGFNGANAGVAVGVLMIAAAWAMFGRNAFELFSDFQWRGWHGYAAAAAMGWCVAVLAAGGNSPFLYFQF